MAIRVCWEHMEPHFWGEGEVVGVSVGTNRKSDDSFLYNRLSIVTVALSVTIRPQFALESFECLRRSNQQGVGDFGPNFRGVPLGADPSCWGGKERTSQAN